MLFDFLWKKKKKTEEPELKPQPESEIDKNVLPEMPTGEMELEPLPEDIDQDSLPEELRDEPEEEVTAAVEEKAAEPESGETETEDSGFIEPEVGEEIVLDEGAVEFSEPEPLEQDLFERLSHGLEKTRQKFLTRLRGFDGEILDHDKLEEIESILIEADLGIKITQYLIGLIEQNFLGRELKKDELNAFLAELITNILKKGLVSSFELQKPLHVILVVGVNGSGKTTTIGKLAHRYQKSKHKVIIAAADTFRAAAIEQLDIWAQRSGVELIKSATGADAAACVYDAIHAGVARGKDILIIDTAGRLHTKFNLMEELKKIQRIVSREIPGAPHETLLVLDAVTGQNGLQQAKTFKEAFPISSLVLTKLDGTAKGGIVVSIREELGLPVKYIGVGEKIYDLQDFNPDKFAKAMFEQ
ncbi:MAG: signal recognition particle-docking protein FtsY [Candidatus Wallbacteria bacterium]|nr:signal recognition particle-docking protein FtsY [Candidatus Wallbacteria bacterium]